MENPASNQANHHSVEEEANINTANEAAVHGRMPGQLLTVTDVTENDNDTSRDYKTVKQLAKEECGPCRHLSYCGINSWTQQHIEGS